MEALDRPRRDLRAVRSDTDHPERALRLALLIEGNVPNPTSGGGALTGWMAATYLAGRGHDMSCIVLHDPVPFDPPGRPLHERAQDLTAAGVAVQMVASEAVAVVNAADHSLRARAARAVHPRVHEVYANAVDAANVGTVVDDLRLDAVLVYHFEALAASTRIRAPRVAAVGDPTHLPLLYRLRGEHSIRAKVMRARVRHQPALMIRLLNECAASGAFAAHHAAWLRERGARNCHYLRTPIPDPGPQPDLSDKKGPLRILLLGQLSGIATMDGLEVFVRMLPELERRLGRTGFEARVVGGGARLPAELRAALEHPAVSFIGHVDNPTDELRRAHCLLVPTSIPLGIRVRILTGLAYGNVIVAHAANTSGIPELEHGVNALIGRDARELAHLVADTRDPTLRQRLRRGARRTYEDAFAPPIAGAAIESLLEEAAAR